MRKQRQIDYAQFLESKLKDTHQYYHILEKQMENQKKNSAKLLNQISALRKKQNDNKLEIKNLKQKLMECELLVNSYKNPQIRKPSHDKTNIAKRTPEPILPKQAFKQFLTDNFPKYKGTIKKMISFVLFFERHWAKSDKQRISTYHSLIAKGIEKLIQTILPNPSTLSSLNSTNAKSENIAKNLVDQWGNSQNKMKQILKERNQLKLKQGIYLSRIEQLQASQASLISNKNGLQAKNFSLEFTIKTKAVQFSHHLKKLLTEKHKLFKDEDQIDEEGYQKYSEELSTILEVMKTVIANKPPETTNAKIIQQKGNKFTINKRTSVKKIRTPAPVLKKNVFGYYEDPQFCSDKPTLTTTIPYTPSISKYVQTTPEDLTLMKKYPILLLKIIDGQIKNNPNRHRLDFYVSISSVDPQKLNSQNSRLITAKIINSQVKQGNKPIWEQKLLISEYSFPFLHFQLMNMTKLSLKDDCIGCGKMQIAQKNIIKEVIVRDDRKQYQGRIRLQLSYPKCSVYLFCINSIEIVVPEDIKILNETVLIQFPYNPKSAISFGVGEKIKYLNHEIQERHIGNHRYPNHYEFLIMPGYVGQNQNQNKLRIKLLQNRKKGSKMITNNPVWVEQGDHDSFFSKTITINMKNSQNWSVILQGSIVTLLSQSDEPEKIEDENDEELNNEQSRKYFSLLAPSPIIRIEHADQMLRSHIKMPLVFRYREEENRIKIFRESAQKQDQKKKKRDLEEEEINPIVEQKCIIAETAIKKYPSLRAPKIVYKVYVKTLQAPSGLALSNNQYYYEKMLQKIELSITFMNYTHKFTIFTSELVQNYYITFSKMLHKEYIKFKVGYTKFQNTLKMPGFKQLSQKDSSSEQDSNLQKQTLDDAYTVITVKDGRLPSFSSTSSYKLIFFEHASDEEKNSKKNTISKKSETVNGRPTWNQKLVLPVNKKLILQVVQCPLMGKEDIIYENMEFEIGQRELKLRTLFINILSPKMEVKGDYILIGDIMNLPELYKIRVSKIHAQIDEKADWIGEIDPYIKIKDPYLGQYIYQTQTLDGIGNSPTWNNDQFESLVALSKFQCYLYDSDIIGKDDYLGVSYFNIQKALSDKYNKDSKINIDLNKGVSRFHVKQMSDAIRKQEKECGKLELLGQFKRIGGKQLKLEGDSKSLNYLENNEIGVIKITIFSLKMNHSHLSQNQAYFLYEDQSVIQNSKPSFPFLLIDNAPIDFSFWPKQYYNKKQKNVKLKLYEKKKNLFKQQIQLLGSATLEINEETLKSNSISFGKSQIILLSSESKGNVIGECYYVCEVVQSIKYLVVEGNSILELSDASLDKIGSQVICDRSKGACLLITDIGDSLTLTNSKESQDEHKFVFYKQDWQIVHPNNSNNSNELIVLENQKADYGSLFNMIAEPFQSIFGSILIHEHTYESQMLRKTENLKQQNQYLSLSHAYFSAMDQPFFEKSEAEHESSLEKIQVVFQLIQGSTVVSSTFYEKINISMSELLNKQSDFSIVLPHHFQPTKTNLYITVIQTKDKNSKILCEKEKMALQQENNELVLSFGKIIKFNGTKYLFSCEFIKKQDCNQKSNNQNLCIFIHWAYLQLFPCLPYQNYKTLNKTINKLKSSEKNIFFAVRQINEEKWFHQVSIEAFKAEVIDDENLISHTLTMAVNTDGNQILKQGSNTYSRGLCGIFNRSIFLKNIKIVFPKTLANKSVELFAMIKSKEKDQSFKLVDLSLSEKNVSHLLNRNYQIYSHSNDVEKFGSLEFNKVSFRSHFSIQENSIAPIQHSKKVTSMQIIKLNQISVTINQHMISEYHSNAFQDFIQVHIIEPSTKAKTICRVRAQTSAKSKQFNFISDFQTSENVVLVPDLQKGAMENNKEEHFRIQIWSGVKQKKSVLQFVNKSELISQGLGYLGQNADYVICELKSVGKKKIMMGKVSMKYQHQYRTADNFCQQIWIDRIIAENCKELAYNSLQIRYFKRNSHKEDEEENSANFLHIVKAQPIQTSVQNTQISRNQTIYKMKAPILFSSNYTSPSCLNLYTYSIISKKYNQICSVISEKISAQNKNAGRWSYEYKFGSNAKLILSGHRSGNLELLSGAQKHDPFDKKLKDENRLISIVFGYFHHLCPNNSKITLQIQTGGSKIQTKSLQFSNFVDFTQQFILERLDCDYLRIHVLGQNNKVPIYSSEQIDITQIVGVSTLYVSNLIENYTKVMMGTVQWQLQPLTTVFKPQSSPYYFIQIIRVSLQIFSDQEWFAQMNPYLQIDNLFATPISIGKQQLFWNLKIIRPIPDSEYQKGGIKIKVMDKDMFFDDLIGSSTLQFKDVLTRYRIDKLQNMSNVELRADLPVFHQKHKDQAVGHIKLHYRIHELPQISNRIQKQESEEDLGTLLNEIKAQQVEEYLKEKHPAIYSELKDPHSKKDQQICIFSQFQQKDAKNLEQVSERWSISLNSIYDPFRELMLNSIYFPICFREHFSEEKCKQIGKVVRLKSIITNNDNYKKKPLCIPLNIENRLIFKNKYKIDSSDNKLDILICLEELKYIFDKPKLNRCNDNVVVSILSRLGSSFVVPQNAGCQAVISSSKYSPQQLDMRMDQQDEGVSLRKKILVGRLCMEQLKRYEMEKMKIVINDNETGFGCASEMEWGKAIVEMLQKQIRRQKIVLTSQIFQNYKATKEYSQNKVIGVGYYTLSLTPVTLKQKSLNLDPSTLRGKHNFGQLKTPQTFIKIVIQSATLFKDIEFFSKMDPYCYIYSKNRNKQYEKVFRTRTEDNKGKNPVWNQSIYLQIEQEIQLYIKVIDQETSVNKSIGDTKFAINAESITESEEKRIKLFKSTDTFIYKETEEIGSILLKIQKPTHFFLVFVNIQYFDINHNWNKDKKIFFEQEQSANTNQWDTSRQITLNQKYPIQLDLASKIRVHLNQCSQDKQSQSSSYTIQALIQLCDACENQIVLIKPGIVLTYFLII